MKIYVPILICVMLTCAVLICFGDGDREVTQDQVMVKENGYWVYNNLEKGIAQAEEIGQPILVVFR